MATKRRRVTANLPADLLDEALRITGKGLTATIVEGLDELRRRAQRSSLRALRGKVRFDLDITRR